jgi:hypothetical protein
MQVTTGCLYEEDEQEVLTMEYAMIMIKNGKFSRVLDDKDEEHEMRTTGG